MTETTTHQSNRALPRVGYIGTGIMGRPMAGHLLKAGYALTVHNRTRAKAEELLTAGAAWADSPAEVAQACEILCTNVTDTPDVERVLFGDGGAAESLQPGSIVIDFSTISPSATHEFAERLAERDVTLLDAPVTGGDVGAINATLTIMVGGTTAAFERVLPILDVVGKTIRHIGPSGSGQALKACNQILCVTTMIGVCEALELADRNGIAAETVIETLGGGAGGSWTLTNLGSRVARGDLQPGFMTYLLQKDLGIVQDLAREMNLPLPGAALGEQLLRATANQPGGKELGFQAMIEVYRAWRTQRGRYNRV